MKKLIDLLLLVVLATAGCGGSGAAEDPDPNLDDIKADSFVAPTHHGTIPPGEVDYGELTAAARYHTWDFALDGPATIDLETAVSSDDRPDTVMYLYIRQADDSWGDCWAKNDNISSKKRFSRIQKEADVGQYRVLVKGKKASTSGRFALVYNCEGEGCQTISSPLDCPAESEINDCFANPEDYNLEGSPSERAATCAEAAQESMSECGLSCYFSCEDNANFCDADGQFRSWVWDAAVEACIAYADKVAN